MLFTSFYTSALLFLAAHHSLASPLTTKDEVLEADLSGQEEVLIAGEPDLALSEKRDLEDGDQFVQLVARQSSSDQSEALRMHNAVRARRGVRALVWDSNLEANALAWAQQLARDRKFEHSDSSQRPGQGENLAYQRSSRPISNPITAGTGLWLAEEQYYNNEPIPQGNFGAYGHYTQCTWNTTTRVGIATATSGNNECRSITKKYEKCDVGLILGS
uniref:SCP domain-containing protein n=1 Tax=Bionectria ochroleuca TaxID=29856 RepID=A0A8H7TNN2_BIOOC